MSIYIKPEALGMYSRSVAQDVQTKTEASQALKETLYLYKQIYYGLRWVAWNYRDRRATFYDALTKGELEPFRLAPGRREADGSYSKDEWDSNRLNRYLWQRFDQSFAEAFNLEAIQELKSFKDVRQAINEILEFALTNWGDILLGSALEQVVDEIEPLRQIDKCALQVGEILVVAKFSFTQRTITLSADGVPSLTIQQDKREKSWKGGIHHYSSGNITLNSQKALLFGKMLELASRLNIGIKQFMANPEGFLGLDTKTAHQKNLLNVQKRLLQINQDQFEKRKAAQEIQTATRRINEAVDAAEEASDEQFEEVRHQANRVFALEKDKLASTPAPGQVTVIQLPPPKTEQRKLTKQQEAEQWLKDNPEFLEDVDAQMGISSIDI